MFKKLRKFISPKIKEKISRSLLYRVLERLRLRNPKINFSCELTTKCNALCDMCTRDSLIKTKELYVEDMSEEIINRILEEIKKFYDYGDKIYFSPMGLGEPFLFKGLFDLFSKIKKISKDIEAVITTNGILLNEECCKKLISLGVDEVSISLNSANPIDYKKHMKIDAYNRVYNNIKNFIKLRNKSGKKLPRIFIQYLDYENNLNIFKKEIKKWLKIMRYDDKCYIHPIVNQAGFYSEGYKANLPRNRYPCTQPLWRIAIKINGDIYPCDPCFYSGFTKVNSLYLGNIKTHSPFQQFISKNSKRLEIVENMRKDDYSLLPECGKCNTYKIASNCFFKSPLKVRGYKWL